MSDNIRQHASLDLSQHARIYASVTSIYCDYGNQNEIPYDEILTHDNSHLCVKLHLRDKDKKDKW